MLKYKRETDIHRWEPILARNRKNQLAVRTITVEHPLKHQMVAKSHFHWCIIHIYSRQQKRHMQVHTRQSQQSKSIVIEHCIDWCKATMGNAMSFCSSVSVVIGGKISSGWYSDNESFLDTLSSNTDWDFLAKHLPIRWLILDGASPIRTWVSARDIVVCWGAVLHLILGVRSNGHHGLFWHRSKSGQGHIFRVPFSVR